MDCLGSVSTPTSIGLRAMGLILSTLIAASSTENTPPAVAPDNSSSPEGQNGGDVHSASVLGIDGTHIDLMIDQSGQAITVATQSPSHKHKIRKHPIVGDNPADEPLSAGLVNESTPQLLEDAMPQVSNDLPH